MQSIIDYKNQIAQHIDAIALTGKPEELYAPIAYILSLGGKQIRPVLTLMAAEIFGSTAKEALAAATAIELFHNFSLIHDDIMDQASLRRGHQTVHEKWDVNTGILSGDAMLILAYQYFENYEPVVFKELAKLFSKTAIEVCEGQQWDVNFEDRHDVEISGYLKMIEYKTAVLVGAALKMGAIVAKTSDKNADLIYDFGLNLGIAFQLQDDYLDAFGDVASFGKRIGGDILENKKTYLYLRAVQRANQAEKQQLIAAYSNTADDEEQKINAVKALFLSTGSVVDSTELIESYTQKALSVLELIDIEDSKKEVLRQFSKNLMGREV
ncbi:polyprenyl synthetase family protein [Flavobacterium sp. JP2137]|uniref:polyprenyl synthetase family protein n=1 Tax=Flavobacterium sp. JP2137 TaxID=3414510 RepID=UPI003D2FC646